MVVTTYQIISPLFPIQGRYDWSIDLIYPKRITPFPRLLTLYREYELIPIAYFAYHYRGIKTK